MKLKEIIGIIETLAPLVHQDEWDNSGLQVTTAIDAEIGSVLVCLDVTEEVVDEAIASGAGLIVSHHPLIFKGLRTVAGMTYQERCVIKALQNGISIYSAHTSLDNSFRGVNHKIASVLGLINLKWLDSLEDAVSGTKGSGLIGDLPEAVAAEEFLSSVKDKFGVSALMHSVPSTDLIRKVALCGGSGAFLLGNAVAAGADCFISGEFHYHDYFDPGTMLVELGHYESEQFTQDLLVDYLNSKCPGLDIRRTSCLTNPIICDK